MTLLALRAVMVQLGFSQDASDEIFNGQGIYLIGELFNLYNDNVKTWICSFLKPGGGRQVDMIRFKA